MSKKEKGVRNYGASALNDRCAARRSGAVCRFCQVAAPHNGDPTERRRENYQRVGAGDRGAWPAGLGALRS